MFVKVFNNEKVGGLTVVSIDRPGFFQKICADPKLKLFRPSKKYPSRDTVPLILCRQSKYRLELWRSLKRFMIERRFLPSSLGAAKIYYTAVSIQCIMWELCCSPILMPCLQTWNDYCIQVIETGFAEQFHNAGTSVEYFSPSNGIVKED